MSMIPPVMPAVPAQAPSSAQTKSNNSGSSGASDFANLLQNASQDNSPAQTATSTDSRPATDSKVVKTANDSSKPVDAKATDTKPVVKGDAKKATTVDAKKGAVAADAKGDGTTATTEDPSQIAGQVAAALNQIALPADQPVAQPVVDAQATAVTVDPNSLALVAQAQVAVAADATTAQQPQLATGDLPAAATDITAIAADASVTTPQLAATDAPVQLDPSVQTDVAADANVLPDDAKTAVVFADLLDTTLDSVSSTLSDAVATDPAQVAAQPAPLDVLNQANAVASLANTPPPQAAQAVDAAAPASPVATPQPDVPAGFEPYRQVVDVVSPLRHRANGTYELTLQLQPQHLGHVEIAVTLNAGQISMQMQADNPNARQMLKESMNDLRQQMESQGIQAGSLDVSTGDQRGGNRENSSPNPRNTGGDAEYTMEDNTFFSRLAATITQLPVSPTGGVDVRA